MDERRADTLKEIQKELGEINVKLGQYNILLDQHIRRTEVLEEQVKLHNRIYSFMEVFFKVVVMTGIIVTIMKTFGVF